MENKEWITVNYEVKNLPADDNKLYNLILKGENYRYNMSLYELNTAYNFEILEKYQIA